MMLKVFYDFTSTYVKTALEEHLSTKMDLDQALLVTVTAKVPTKRRTKIRPPTIINPSQVPLAQVQPNPRHNIAKNRWIPLRTRSSQNHHLNLRYLLRMRNVNPLKASLKERLIFPH